MSAQSALERFGWRAPSATRLSALAADAAPAASRLGALLLAAATPILLFQPRHGPMDAASAEDAACEAGPRIDDPLCADIALDPAAAAYVADGGTMRDFTDIAARKAARDADCAPAEAIDGPICIGFDDLDLAAIADAAPGAGIPGDGLRVPDALWSLADDPETIEGAFDLETGSIPQDAAPGVDDPIELPGGERAYGDIIAAIEPADIPPLSPFSGHAVPVAPGIDPALPPSAPASEPPVWQAAPETVGSQAYLDWLETVSSPEVASDLTSSDPDPILGGPGDDVLVGTDWDDILSAGDGADRLLGGAGDDRLEGGAGADVFVFDAAGSGDDTLVDFVDGEDLIEIASAAGAAGMADLTIVQDGADALVSFDAATLRLLDVSAAALEAADFHFV